MSEGPNIVLWGMMLVFAGSAAGAFVGCTVFWVLSRAWRKTNETEEREHETSSHASALAESFGD